MEENDKTWPKLELKRSQEKNNVNNPSSCPDDIRNKAALHENYNMISPNYCYRKCMENDIENLYVDFDVKYSETSI